MFKKVFYWKNIFKAVKAALPHLIISMILGLGHTQVEN
jgi:hypothetical protein